MQRMIETTRTYRIPHGNKYALLRVRSIKGDTLSVEDLKTGRRFSMKKSTFQRGLNEGHIYVSSALVEAVSGGWGTFRVSVFLPDGKVISKTTPEEFRKSVGAGHTEFLKAVIDRYNKQMEKEGQEQRAKIEVKGMDF